MAVQAVGRTRPQTVRDQALGRLEKRSSSNGHAKARDAGTSSVVEENGAEAKKHGVVIKLWQRGVRQGKPVPTFIVLVSGGRLRALSGNFDSLAAAKKAVSGAGLKVAES